MSRTPGKTKHLQTLEIPGITLCDCPGLVFPTVVASRAHLVINGVVPIMELKDSLQPIRLIIEKLGLPYFLKHLNISQADLRAGAEKRGEGELDDARALLAGLATVRGRLLRYNVPDEA